MSGASSAAAPFRRIWEILRAAALRFYRDGCLLHASALTYTSLLSLVPFLALMFAVLKGLGAAGRLESWLLTRLGLSQEVTDQIVYFVSETNVGTLTTLGTAALLFTAISVLGNIESSLNNIWRVRSGRVWWRKISDYLSVVLVTPFLLLAAVGVTSFFAEQETLRHLLENQIVGSAAAYTLRLVPFGFNILALAILYVVMPNRRPHVPSVTIAAIVAGVIWQLVQITYVELQIGVARANLIYGAFAQLPVTLVWIYVSWTVVLAGAELAAVIELGADDALSDGDVRPRWAVGIQVMLRAAERFSEGGGMVTSRHLAGELRLNPAEIEAVADRLCIDGLLIAVEGSRAAYALGRAPERIKLAEMASALDIPISVAGWDPRVRGLIEGARAQRDEFLERTTLADFIAGERREEKRTPSAPTPIRGDKSA